MGLHARTWFTPKQRAELWERWRSGQCVADIARALERKNKSGVYRVLALSGGIAPLPRRRAAQALRLAEREEILRGIAAGWSMRQIALETEARLLDQLLFEDWLKLFAPECVYWVPSTPEGGDPRSEIAVMFDDRRRLEDRVFRLRTGYAWSQAPSSRTSRLICNVEVFSSKTPDQRMIRSNFSISEFWDNEIRALAGWTGHRFRKIDGVWKISAKQINLLNCDQCIRNPSIIL